MKAADVLVSGRVQKVGFRAFVKRNASMLGVKGYVENLSDGRVHAVFEGEDIQVDKLLELLWHGPAGAQVREVKVVETDRSGHKSFEVR